MGLARESLWCIFFGFWPYQGARTQEERADKREVLKENFDRLAFSFIEAQKKKEEEANGNP